MIQQPYNQRDHMHCFQSSQPPCGIKGLHRCCLCEKEVPEELTPSKDTREEKELPPIKDKIQQIFKFLEIADVSQWQGMNVFEAGDADTLYGILETAFEQVIKEERERCKEIVESLKVNQTPYVRNHGLKPHPTDTLTSVYRKGFNQFGDDLLSALDQQ